MGEYRIELQNLKYKVGKKCLLKNIDWKVRPKEHWIIFGLNGSGKTTLLSIIAGYKCQSEGEVKVFGETYCDENFLQNRKRIGLVSASLFDRYYTSESVLQIILSGLIGTLGLDFTITDKDVKRAKELLKKVGLGQKIDQNYNSLSKGERECVLIARALIGQPEILILDEPCSGLDVMARERMLNTIEALAEQDDMTLIYVTHYMEEILGCFENALFLKNGKIYKKGASSELFTEKCMSDFLENNIKIRYNERGRLSFFAQNKQKIELYEGGETV